MSVGTTKRNGVASSNGNGRPAKNRVAGMLDVPAMDAPSSKKLTAKAMATEDRVSIKIDRPVWQWMRVLVHIPMLLSNKFRHQALQDMILAQLGKKPLKKPRDPEQEFIESAHICKGGYDLKRLEKNLYGFPAVGLKKAVAAAAFRFGGAKNMVNTLGILFINGPYRGLVPLYEHIGESQLKSPKSWTPAVPHMRTDQVVLGGGKPVASVAFRAEFTNVSAVLDIRYWDPVFSQETALTALGLAGETVGIGSWRIEKGGIHGALKIGGVMELPSDYEPECYGEAVAEEFVLN